MLKIASLTLIIIGSLLLLVGLLFEHFNLTDMFKGIYSGPIFLVLGIVMFLFVPKKKDNNHN